MTKRKPRPDGYWKDFENLKKELGRITKKIGHLPTGNELNKMGESGVSNAFIYHGGIRKIRKKLGAPQIRRENGYLQNWKNFQSELVEVIENLGHFPSQSDLKNYGRSYLIPGFEHHGGTYVVREKMGFPSETKQGNYWKDLENIVNELEELWQKCPELQGKVPSSYWLNKNKYSYLNSAIHNHHGSITQLRKRLGQDQYSELRKKYNQYSTKKQVLTGLKQIWEKHPELDGTVPSDDWLREHSFGALGQAIVRIHGGFVRFREKFDLKGKGKANKFKKGELRDWQKCRDAIYAMYEKHPELKNRIPTVGWMVKNGYEAITKSVRLHHGGITAVRQKFGQESLYREKGLLENFEYIKEELEKLIRGNPELNGQCPNYIWLQRNGHSSLIHGINKYHGGLESFREIFGGKSLRSPNHYWHKWKNAEAELRKIIEDIGHFPTQKELAVVGRSGLAQAIHQTHGGFFKVKEKMGYESARKPGGYWKELENVEQEIQEIIKSIGEFPSYNRIKEECGGGLVSAIIRYHGGINSVRERMGYSEFTTGSSLLEIYVGGKD